MLFHLGVQLQSHDSSCVLESVGGLRALRALCALLAHGRAFRSRLRFPASCARRASDLCTSEGYPNRQTEAPGTTSWRPQPLPQPFLVQRPATRCNWTINVLHNINTTTPHTVGHKQTEQLVITGTQVVQQRVPQMKWVAKVNPNPNLPRIGWALKRSARRYALKMKWVAQARRQAASGRPRTPPLPGRMRCWKSHRPHSATGQ